MTVAKKSAPSRTYRSELREGQARRTRETVLDAATECFVADGYASTTMKNVAARAGVSVETVYAQGSKKALLLAAVDRAIAGDDEPVPFAEREEMRGALAAPTPHEVLARLRETVEANLEASLPMMAAFTRAAGVDPEIAAVYAEYEGRRRADMELFAAALAPGLRPGVTRDEAADVLSMLFSTPAMDELVRTRGWGGDRFAAWVTEAAARLLLTGEHPPRP